MNCPRNFPFGHVSKLRLVWSHTNYNMTSLLLLHYRPQLYIMELFNVFVTSSRHVDVVIVSVLFIACFPWNVKCWWGNFPEHVNSYLKEQKKIFIFRPKVFHCWITIGGSRGPCPAHAPHGTQFFRFRIHFHQKVPTSEVHTPPNGCTPPLWEILDPPLITFHFQEFQSAVIWK